MTSVLSREVATFNRLLPALLATPGNEGQYVLIFGDDVRGVYPTFDDAAEAGYELTLSDPFLVKQIVESEEPVYFSRNIDPCH